MQAPLVLLSQALLAALLLGAAVSDLRRRRVSNRWVLLGLFLGLGLHGLAQLAGDPALAGSAWWSPLAGLLVGGALLMPLYLLRATGAGDVKLMAMVGAFVGAAPMPATLLYTLLAGGLLSLLFFFSGRQVASQTGSNLRLLFSGDRIAPLQRTAARLPYALAIALGTLAAQLWPLSRLLQGAAS